MKERGQAMLAIGVAKQVSPGSERDSNKRAGPAAGTVRTEVTEKYIDEIRDCLSEQLRLLAAAPEFGNKSLISNCAQVSLMLIKQLRCAAAGRGEAENRIRGNFNASR
jgi:hypothetical protein